MEGNIEVEVGSLYKFEIISTPEYNSEPESVYSVQGYETAIVRDYSSGSLSSFSDANVSVGDIESVYYNSDNEAFYLSEVGSVGEILSGEDHYAIEYDIASIASSKHGDKSSSEGESDAEENVIALLQCVYDAETDLEFWADSSNCEDSSTDDPDITDGDKWQCQHCKNFNWPTMRFCQKCWKVRKNWLPQQRRRPPKRLRRKRSKLEFSVSSKRRRLNYAARQRTETMSSNDESIRPTTLDLFASIDVSTKLSAKEGNNSNVTSLGQTGPSNEVCTTQSEYRHSMHDSGVSSQEQEVSPCLPSAPFAHQLSLRSRNATVSEKPLSACCELRTSSCGEVRTLRDSKSASPEQVGDICSGSFSSSQSTADITVSSSQALRCSQSTVDTCVTSSQESVAANESSAVVDCCQSAIASLSSCEKVNCCSQSTPNSSLSSPQQPADSEANSSGCSQATTDNMLTSSQEDVLVTEMHSSISCSRLMSDSGLSSSQEQVVDPPCASDVANDSQNTLPQLQGFLPNSSSTDSHLCLLCASRQKNACISHGSFGHLLTCFRCAQKLFQNEQPCPFCRRNIRQVIRVLELG